MVHCYFKSCKGDCVLPKLELAGAEGDVITQIKPVQCLEKTALQIIWPKERIIYIFCHVLCIWYYFIKAMGLAIPWGDVAEWCNSIMIASPWCDENGEILVVFMKGSTMITIPTVKNSFLFVAWYSTSLMKQGSGVMGFPSCISIKSLEVYCSSGFFFAQMTILWHHVMGSPIGTSSITANHIAWSSPVLTSSWQCSGAGMGVWWVASAALGSIIRHRGFVSIMGSS